MNVAVTTIALGVCLGVYLFMDQRFERLLSGVRDTFARAAASLSACFALSAPLRADAARFTLAPPAIRSTRFLIRQQHGSFPGGEVRRALAVRRLG